MVTANKVAITLNVKKSRLCGFFVLKYYQHKFYSVLHAIISHLSTS
ncbi:hypothetical protein PCARR_a2233 [Pseudoalteromonas carrageenovora IAM 12662]|uniref:Transposase n=1 Tax=Pseudoalteromonas carrageenovora IAM 12662 TaxID=1314868 RepID=A0ABR9ETM4_PSEVC|nr:hypothetical protein [Pseudoalteromonas carrageenovora IAM 12662]